VSTCLRHRIPPAVPACVALLALCVAASASASSSGGTPYVPPAKKARLVNGKAIAPKGAPLRVRRVIRAANRLVRKPYRYGGGHRSFRLDSGYDCSGAVSYALYGGRLIRRPRTSGGFMSWGRRGRGRWITVYANRGHAYMVVAGLRFDTSLRDRSAYRGRGPRWSRRMRSSRSFRARHPRGL
jgi:hypothetical protein